MNNNTAPVPAPAPAAWDASDEVAWRDAWGDVEVAPARFRSAAVLRFHALDARRDAAVAAGVWVDPLTAFLAAGGRLADWRS